MNIGVVGCAGRMGRMLVSAILETEGAVLAGGTERSGHPAVGDDLAALGGAASGARTVGDDTVALFAAADVVIDFTVPDATAAHAALAARHGTALVIGTTGLTLEQQGAIDRAAESVPIVQAANMSVGINLLLDLTRRVAATLGADYDIEIVEMHHRHKVDAPSGTALALGHAAASGRGVALDTVSQRVRDGHTGARRTGDIGFATLRGGDIVGEHTVVFAGDGERIELTHRATTRAVFARGAVRAALWTDGKSAGLYHMWDVLAD